MERFAISKPFSYPTFGFMKLYKLYFIFILIMGKANQVAAQKDLSLSIFTSYENEDFHWSVSGNYLGQNPNILSELSWKKLKEECFGANIEWKLHPKWIVNISGSVLRISSGIVKDMDYKGDNRTEVDYYGIFTANKGNKWSLSSGISYRILENNIASLNTELGFKWSHQQLYLLPGKYDSSLQQDGLNSTYTIINYGPYIGLVPQISLNRNIKIGTNFDYYFLVYNANANWNLVSNFNHPVSFTHNAYAHSFELTSFILFQSTLKISYFIKLIYTNTTVCDGTDALHLNTNQILLSHFNGGKDKIEGIILGIKLIL